MKMYHFTSARHWPFIKADGVLKRTETNLDMVREHAGPDAVWLLDTPEVGEHPHGLVTPMDRVDKTEIRFAVDAPERWTVKWLGWAHMQGINDLWLHTMVQAGGGQEAAEHWYICFKPLKRSAWLSVDNVKTGENLWVP